MRFPLRVAGVLAAVLIASCGQQESGFEQDTASVETQDVAEAPDISPTAAPGVAFSYDYDFRLADQRIDEVQEAHAARCEALGIDRCRITGLRYSLGADDQVSGMLQVKLDPSIARGFGKAAVTGVEQAGGKLINAEFTGEDEGSEIRRSSQRQSETERQIAEFERRLASLPSGDRERTELQQQLERLRVEAAAARSAIRSSEERLALTPMTFNYYGKGGVPGFGGSNPIEESWHAFIASGVTMITVLLHLIGVLLPWAVLLLLIVLLWRSRIGRGVRSWWSRSPYREPPEA